MKKILKSIVMLLGIIASLFLICSISSKRPKEITVQQVKEVKDLEQKKEPISVTTPKQTTKPEKTTKTEDCFATITSFGDTLCHKPVYNAAYDEKTGIYDFSSMFKYIENYFKESTINIGNCESPMAGEEIGYSGYPTFNAPGHLAIDLKELGVDIMTTANNHALDKGFNGLSSTLDFLDNAEIAHVGTARTQEEQDTILFKDLNGIKTAFLSFTYGTNGIQVPEDKQFCINLIDEDLILKQIEQAKEKNAELIVASMHWGVEYQTVENEEQDKLAEFLIANDVKIILGCHPHVLQPMKMIEVQTEEGKKEGLVIFSQGNFFSNQRDVNTRNTAIFNIEIKKDGKTGEVTVQKATYAPIYVNIKEPGAKDRYELLDLNEIIRSYEAGEKTWSESMYKLAIAEKDRCCSLIGPEIENSITK